MGRHGHFGRGVALDLGRAIVGCPCETAAMLFGGAEEGTSNTSSRFSIYHSNLLILSKGVKEWI